MGHPRDDDLLEVAQPLRERLGPVRGVGRQPGPDLAGGDRFDHRPGLERGQVVGDPVDEGVAVGAERVEVEWVLRHPISFSKRSSTSPGSA